MWPKKISFLSTILCTMLTLIPIFFMTSLIFILYSEDAEENAGAAAADTEAAKNADVGWCRWF